MKLKYSFLLFIGFLFFACKNTDSDNGMSKVFLRQNNSTEQLPYAELKMPAKVDMGVFEGDQLKKSTTILIQNIGNDTLYIHGAQVECDCTELHLNDSVVAPYMSTSIDVTLDLSEYPNDTIYKTFGVLSNSRTGNVIRCDVFGLRK